MFAVVFFLGLALEPPSAEPVETIPNPAANSVEPGAPGTLGVTPFEADAHTPPVPPERPPDPPDRKTAMMVRVNLLFGPVWRIRTVDPFLVTGVEYGRMHGFSGAFHASFIPPPPQQGFGEENTPRVLETALGLGPVLRGRLKRPLYGSVGLTAGIRIHRAATDIGVVRRVDPELRVPIQAAWTIARVGLSLAVVQGYSFRARAYESRGVVQWSRTAYHVSLLFGVHFDVMTRGDRGGRSVRKRSRR